MKIHFLESYVDRNSLIHRLDARTKFIITVIFILMVIITPPAAWVGFGVYLALIACMLIISRVPITHVLKRSLLIIPFIGIIAASVPFIKEGEIIGSIRLWSWQISITRAGFDLFATILLKAWLSAVSLIILTAATRVVDLLKGLEQMRIPMVFIMIISSMYRYIFVLTDDVLRMKQARDSRSFGNRYRWRVKTIGNMIGTLFVRSYERGERVYSAMLSRGYDGRVRTMKQPHLGKADILFGTVFSLLLITSGIWISLSYQGLK